MEEAEGEPTRTIVHVDMDHFFTAVEEREHPEFRGRPVIVGADPKEGQGRGVVSTCNYEARRFGARSGMPISRVWKLCPQAIYLPVNYELYRKVSTAIMNILKKYGDHFEQWGIDEAFLDATSKVSRLDDAKEIACKVKEEILRKERLTCSVGIGPNKLVAKIASDYQKPDGLTIIAENEVKRFLAPLPVRKLLWVGRKTEQKLKAMNIKTIGDLARCNPAILSDKFGVMGTQLYLMAHGIDRSKVKERDDIKSVSRELTFEKDTEDPETIFEALDRLSKEVHGDIMQQQLLFRTVTVKIRYENFETHTHGKSLPLATNRLLDLQKTARRLIQHYLTPERKVRLIGVRASNFTSGEKQMKLI